MLSVVDEFPRMVIATDATTPVTVMTIAIAKRMLWRIVRCPLKNGLLSTLLGLEGELIVLSRNAAIGKGPWFPWESRFPGHCTLGVYENRHAT
jgi:hypothetical protein